MKKLIRKVISVIMLVTIVVLSLNFSHVSAATDKITQISFDKLKGEDGKANLFIEEQTHFSVLADLAITYAKKGTYVGFIEKNTGLTFKSDDENVLKLSDPSYGVFETLKTGEANITVSYPGLDSLKLNVTVVAKGSYDKDGSNRIISDKLDSLYKVEYSNDNIIDFYKDLKSVTHQISFVSEEHYAVIPNYYVCLLIWDKIDAYMKKENAIYYSSEPLAVKKVSNITAKGVKVTLSRKLNNNDIVAYCMMNQKNYSKNMKMQFRTIFVEGKKGAKSPYEGKFIDDVNVKLAAGTDSYTVKLPSKIKKGKVYSVLFSIDDYYGYTWTKGTYFTAK